MRDADTSAAGADKRNVLSDFDVRIVAAREGPTWEEFYRVISNRIRGYLWRQYGWYEPLDTAVRDKTKPPRETNAHVQECLSIFWTEAAPRALANYRPERGTVWGYLRRVVARVAAVYVVEQQWSTEHYEKMRRRIAEAEAEAERPLSDEEAAAAIGVKPETVQRARTARMTSSSVEEEGGTIEDRHSDSKTVSAELGTERAELREMQNDCLERMKPLRDAEILRLRYFEGLTGRQTAERLGMTDPNDVYEIQGRAEKKLTTCMHSKGVHRIDDVLKSRDSDP